MQGLELLAVLARVAVVAAQRGRGIQDALACGRIWWIQWSGELNASLDQVSGLQDQVLDGLRQMQSSLVILALGGGHEALIDPSPSTPEEYQVL